MVDGFLIVYCDFSCRYFNDCVILDDFVLVPSIIFHACFFLSSSFFPLHLIFFLSADFVLYLGFLLSH